MASEIQFQNNCLRYQEDFKTDIGLLPRDNLGLYLQYYSARCADNTSQAVMRLTQNMTHDLKYLPDNIRLQIDQMIREHETIQQLLKK